MAFIPDEKTWIREKDIYGIVEDNVLKIEDKDKGLHRYICGDLTIKQIISILFRLDVTITLLEGSIGYNDDQLRTIANKVLGYSTSELDTMSSAEVEQIWLWWSNFDGPDMKDQLCKGLLNSLDEKNLVYFET